MNKALLIGGLVVLVLVVGVAFAMQSNNNELATNETNTSMPSERTDDMGDEMNNQDMDTPENSAENMDNMNDENEGVMVGGAMMTPDQTLVANAQAASNLTTLVSAVEAAGLAEILANEGPFTVFAPNNAAFAALPEGTLDELLMEENQDQLANILTYHVVPGVYTAADLEDGQTLTTVQGAELEVSVEGSMVMINGNATVQTANARAENGVAHVIDAVLMPPQAS